MNKFNVTSAGYLNSIPGFDKDKILIAKRTAEVQSMWSEVVEKSFLDHTNSIYILRDKGLKVLHVYMDDSIFAAELNARRELIRAQLAVQFGEEIDEFTIHISRGKYKKQYPFKNKELPSYIDDDPSIALDDEEKKHVEELCNELPEGQLRDRFKQAMISDLQWMKGKNKEK